MNLPNKLTVIRLALAFVMTFFLVVDAIPFGWSIGLVIFIIGALTDYWDGKLARTVTGITAFGQLMDPVADKVLVCAAFICFVAQDQLMPAWVVVLVIAREFMVTGLRLIAVNKGKVIPAGFWGKQKTIWQIVVIIVIMLGVAVHRDILPLFVDVATGAEVYDRFNQVLGVVAYALSTLIAALTVISGWVYFSQNRDLFIHDM